MPIFGRIFCDKLREYVTSTAILRIIGFELNAIIRKIEVRCSSYVNMPDGHRQLVELSVTKNGWSQCALGRWRQGIETSSTIRDQDTLLGT